jgi:3'-phosphoadenosine 5'-phosphosulfate sulfotransferase (PAPS reductase)/FAD synthetase
MKDLKYTPADLKAMQAWPLARKIQVAQTRIIEWHQRHEGKVFVSVSGGKDSTVLLDLARRCHPDIEAVYVDTGLDFPEVRRFAMAKPNVTVLKPKRRFNAVVREYGWCYPSKDVANTVYYARRGSAWAKLRLDGVNADGSPSKWRKSHYVKWKYLVESPFKISAKCCGIMKEQPLNAYGRKTGKHPIVGTLAEESERRKQAWLQTGCNNFSPKHPVSKPMSFWTNQDVLAYIRGFHLPIASVYGEIVEDAKGRLYTTGEQRTGCVFCPVGCHLDKVNRFQRMKNTHPKLHKYCMEQLGLAEFLKYIGVEGWACSID